jgi:hypothetical protein
MKIIVADLKTFFLELAVFHVVLIEANNFSFPFMLSFIRKRFKTVSGYGCLLFSFLRSKLSSSVPYR